ncbi:hypothetical protein EDD85DRAFT_955084 [Armillaria nabsnona]|nr:hypothetical protein EDD85DRAFT_955084 [Armillaria nabsnona]
MLGIPDPGVAMHCMARISNFGAASNAPNANSMLDLGTTHSGSVFKWWEDIEEYMIDVDINDLALSLPQPTAECASDVALQPIPLSSPNPSKPLPQPMSSSNATPILEHLHSRQHKSFKSHQKFRIQRCQVQETMGLPVKQIALKCVAASSILATQFEPARRRGYAGPCDPRRQDVRDYTLEELLRDHSMKLIECGGRKQLRIINNQGRVIVYNVGHPEEFNEVSKETIKAFERAVMSLQALYAQNSQIYPFITPYLRNDTIITPTHSITLPTLDNTTDFRSIGHPHTDTILKL